VLAKSLAARGMEAAVQMLGQAIGKQATVIAFDTAFLTVTLFLRAVAVIVSRLKAPGTRARAGRKTARL